MAGVNLNTRLALESAVNTPDGMGGYSTAWRQLGWLWAQLSSRSARQTGTGTGTISVIQWRITVRGAPAGDPRRPQPGQRLRLGPRLFLIEAVAESDPNGRFLDCFAREEGFT